MTADDFFLICTLYNVDKNGSFVCSDDEEHQLICLRERLLMTVLERESLADDAYRRSCRASSNFTLGKKASKNGGCRCASVRRWNFEQLLSCCCCTSADAHRPCGAGVTTAAKRELTNRIRSALAFDHRRIAFHVRSFPFNYTIFPLPSHRFTRIETQILITQGQTKISALCTASRILTVQGLSTIDQIRPLNQQDLHGS